MLAVAEHADVNVPKEISLYDDRVSYDINLVNIKRAHERDAI